MGTLSITLVLLKMVTRNHGVIQGVILGGATVVVGKIAKLKRR